MSNPSPAPGVTVTHRIPESAWNARLDDTIATVSVDNQARLNCLSTATVTALREAVQQLGRDPNVRAIIITGAGEKSFIGGADLRELGSLDHDGGRLYITNLHKACDAIRNAPQPVIARVNGFCLGGGLEVAAACDMRTAAETAVFGMPEVHMGLPSVIEAALLPGLIGWGMTREILITGETFDAARAAEMRFVERVVPKADLDAAVDGWLAAICRAAPEAVLSQKRLINRWQETSVKEGIKAGIDALAEAYDTGEPQQRIRDFFAAKDKLKG
jgi:enoyl-CoA hydratase